MNKRINITLPEQTVRLLDKIIDKGDRSKFIYRAISRYIKEQTKANIRKQLIEGYEANAEFDLKLAEEWFPIDQQAWDLMDKDDETR
jgi:CopG family transcriptional regulator/antitoxin EndoAI